VKNWSHGRRYWGTRGDCHAQSDRIGAVAFRRPVPGRLLCESTLSGWYGCNRSNKRDGQRNVLSVLFADGLRRSTPVKQAISLLDSTLLSDGFPFSRKRNTALVEQLPVDRGIGCMDLRTVKQLVQCTASGQVVEPNGCNYIGNQQQHSL
jgi:hypothetical protein